MKVLEIFQQLAIAPAAPAPYNVNVVRCHHAVNPASQFHVKRACGHVELLPELLPRDEEERYPDRASLLAAREQALIALEAMACINCFSRGDIQALVAEFRRMGLALPDAPTMIGGTVRQTRLARLLRSRKMAEIRDAYARYRTSLDQRVATGVVARDEAVRQRAWCERSIAAVLAVKDPDWWIEGEARGGWDLVRAAARAAGRP